MQEVLKSISLVSLTILVCFAGVRQNFVSVLDDIHPENVELCQADTTTRDTLSQGEDTAAGTGMHTVINSSILIIMILILIVIIVIILILRRMYSVSKE